MKTFKKLLAESSEDYHDSHIAPRPGDSSPLHDVTGTYPTDFYSSKGAHYYGDGSSYDGASHKLICSLRGKPDAPVKVYRGVPKDVDDINHGDWVSISKGYAKDHAERRLGNNGKVISKTVKAKELFTDGNSIHEQGYHSA